MKRHLRASLVALVVLAVAGSPAGAQSAGQGTAEAEIAPDAARATQVLATESAARVGISRTETRDDAEAPAMQTQGQMVRWIVIFAVVVLAAVVLLAVAD